MINNFDEARLDDQSALGEYDQQLRYLAQAGARIRVEAADAGLPEGLELKPRGVVVVGAEARLIRAVLEPVCPVPLIAWSLPGLPGWAELLTVWCWPAVPMAVGARPCSQPPPRRLDGAA